MSGVNIRIGATNVTGGVFRSVNASLTTLNKKVATIGDSMSSAMKNAGASVGLLGAAITGVGIAAISTFIGAASDMQETMGKFSVVFGDSANDVMDWGNANAEALGISQQSMAGMLSSMQDLLVPMGVVPQVATDMSKKLSTLAVDLGSFNNMSSDRVFDDLTAALTGSGEVMKKYGVILSEAGVKQELMNMKIDPKTADEAAKAQARLNIIFRGTTAAQGDAIRTSDSFANQMKRLGATASDIKTAIGSSLVNSFAGVLVKVNQAASSIKVFVNQNPQLIATASTAIVAITAFGGTLTTIGAVAIGAGIALSGFVAIVTAIGTAITFALSPIGIVVVGITASIAGLSAVLISAGIKTGLFTDAFEHAKVILANFWDTAKEAFAGITDALKANDWALAAKIGWAGLKVAFFEGLGDITMAFAQMVPKMWGIMQNLFIKMVDNAWKSTKLVGEILANPFGAENKILDFVSKLSFDPGKGISGFIKEHTAAARSELEALKAQASQAASEIVVPKPVIQSGQQDGAAGLSAGVADVSGAINAAGSGFADKIKSAFSKATNLITGTNIGDAIASQVTSAANTAKQVIGGAAKSVAGKVDAVLGQGDGKLTDSVIAAISKIGTEAYTSVGDVNSALKNLGFQAPETWNLKTDKSLKLDSPTLTANISRLATRGQNQSIQEKTAQNTADTKVAVKAVEAGVTKAVGILDAIFKKPSAGLSLTKVGA